MTSENTFQNGLSCQSKKIKKNLKSNVLELYSNNKSKISKSSKIEQFSIDLDQ